MNEDTMKEIIRDAHSLAKAENVTADIVRAGAETIARRLERLVAHGLYITPKAALDAVAGERPLDKMLKTPMSEGVEECGSEGVKNRGLVGIRFNDMSIVAWDLCDNKNIRVTAKKLNERCWHVDGYVADTLRISATVFGGKWATLRYVKFIRNGLMSRVMRRKHGARNDMAGRA